MLKYLLIAVLIVAGLSMIGFSFGKNAGESKNLVTYEELQKKLTAKENFILLDVRTHEEFADGHIPGSILLPYDAVAQKAATMLTDKNKAIIVYCRSGRRSAIAADSLRQLGYKHVRDFGGINRWHGALEH
ncbi:MAG: rhodanese-like domain-containing protein [Phascolarctobacterium sp.]|jgi:putative lipoprotein